MSIRVQSLVWDSGLYSGGTLIILLALADWANDDGDRVFPSLETLARKARLSVRAAQLCLRRLQKDGVIQPLSESKGGRGKVTQYRINLERVQYLRGLAKAGGKGCKASAKPCKTVEQKGEVKSTKGENPAAYIDNHQEPSGDPSLHASEVPAYCALEPWPAVWAAFKSWPNFSVTASEERARGAWQRLHDTLPPDLVDRITQHGVAIETENARRGRAGRAWIAHPHNWLERDRGWERYGGIEITQVKEEEARAAWGGEAALLIDAIGYTKFQTWFADAQFDRASAVTILVSTRAKYNYARENFLHILERIFGEVALCQG